MSKISTYEVTPVPKLADKLIGTSVGGEIEDITYNFTLSELLNLFIPNIPANTLQGVLDYGNTATQDIILNGTIFTTYIEVTDTATILNSYLTGDTHILGGLYDSLDSIGTAGQVLISTGDGIEWYSVPTITPDLQQVLTSGNTADVDIVLDANLEAIVVSANAAVIGSQLTVQGTLMDYNESTGTSGQVLASNSTTVQWIDLPVYTATSPLSIDNITKVISIQQANASQNGYLSSADWITFDGKQGSISLTTIGSSGPSTLVGSVINVPNYTLSGLGGVPQTRTLTINGITYNLSADRTWTIAAGVSSVTATTPLFSTGGVNPDISIQQSSSSLDGYLSNVDWLTFNSKQPAGNYITSLTGEATAAGPGAAAVTLSNAAVIGKLLTGLSITGSAITSSDSILTAFGKVQNQINGLIGGVQYQGVWNAATNTPALVSSVGTQGYYYIVSVAGNTNLNGITDWQVGDWAIFNGSTWNKVDNTDLVTSVNGQIGAVSLTTDNIPEGATNLYYLNSRARAALSFAAGSGAYNSTTGVITIPTDNSQILNGAGYITLASLSASSPLSYNNLTGVFSIQVANTTQNGYLSSTDWNTFNGKQPFLGGTGLVKSVAGTISYITDNSTNWNTAYNDSIVSAAVTGTATKTLTLNQQDGGTITASWSDIDTGLTSVGVSMPSAFSVANSPLTSNGTIAVTGAGTTLQYIDGTGALQSFPSLTGYVPYTGATANVNLGIYNLTAASLIKSGGTSSQFLKADGSVDSSAYIVLGSLSATAPLSYNSTTGAFTISQAGTASNGYLSSTDWNTFNDKQPFITAGTTLQYYRGDKTFQTLNTTAVPEGTNLYFTNARAIASTLTGYVSGAGTISATDSLLTAIQKLNGNISGLTTGVSSVFGRTGAVIAVSGDYTTTLVPEGTNLYYLDSRARAAVSLTTTGSSGASTYNSTTGVFNIPNYGAALSGYVPTSRTLNINGTSYDLSADRSWSVGTVTSVAALTLGTTGTDLSSSVATGTTTPVITLNVPTASAANRGALSSADWSTFNGKVSGVTATSPLASSGGTTPNITIQQSSGSQAGFLSAADWTTFNNKQAAGNYITSLTGEATATGPGAASVTLSNSAVTAKVLTGINITGGTVVDTDSILTGFGKLQNQINSLIGSTIYKGTWNASTNTPTLASGVGTRGWYYIVSVAGTTNLDGITDWFVGDWAIFDGTAWQQVDNTDAVVSVNGFTGAVSLTTDNIPEGTTNLYYTNTRARAALSFTAGSGAYNSTTGVITIPTNNNQITNGSNYITLASLSGTAPISYNSGTGAISITQSGTASNGYLSSTDWNTFNNKQAALTNPVLASGTWTSGYLPKINGSYTITNSIAYDGGSSIGINTNAPYDNTQFKLDVNGGFIVKNTSGVAAQFVLIDANPASGGNAGFFIQSVGGTSTAAWGQVQTYYGTSIASGALRLQPSGGQILVGTTTPSAFMVDINGTLRVVGQLTLSSTITNGTYTYTLPGATGTIALVGGAGVGTVTSVAALTIGTTGTDLSSTVANSTTTPVITLNVPTASATNRGALSAADWTTFNSKAPSVTGGYLPLSGGTMTGPITLVNGGIGIIVGDDATISDNNVANTMFVAGNQNSDRGYINFSLSSNNSLGAINGGALTWRGATVMTTANISGTTNYIPKFTAANAIGDSVIQESSSNIGIGISPVNKLDVNGSIRAMGYDGGGTGAGLELFFLSGISYVSSQDRGVSGYVPLYIRSSATNFTNGSVGIGITPTQLLDVNGNGKFRGQDFFLGSSTAADNVIYIYSKNGAESQIRTNAGVSSSYNGMMIASNYNQANSLSSWSIDLGGALNSTSNVNAYTLGYKAYGGAWASLMTVSATGSTTFTSGVVHYVGSSRMFASNGSSFNYLYTGSTQLSINNSTDTATVASISNTGAASFASANISSTSILTTASTTLLNSRGIIVDAATTTNDAFIPIGYSWASSISNYNPYWGMALKTVSYSSGTANLVFYTAGSVRFTIGSSGEATFNSTVILPNNTYLQFKNTSGVAQTVLTTDTGNSTVLRPSVSGGYIAFQNYANNANNVLVADSGIITFNNLAGTGTRMVVADASGNLSTQTIGSGSITGSGTTNYVPKFTSSSAIGNSVIIDSGSDVTVGSFLRVNAYGNTAGGTIRMGVVNDSTAKWSYLVSTQYNSSSNPQGFSVIGAYTSSTANDIIIGGSIYEANPATSIQFWTYTATTHALGGIKRMQIDTNGIATFYYGSIFNAPMSINGGAVPSDRWFEISGTTSGKVFGAVINPTFTYTGANIYGLYLNNNFGTGTITNSYALYIDSTSVGSATVTNKYGIYQASGSDRNYLAGNVGIGTVSPNAMLDVYTSQGGSTIAASHSTGGSYPKVSGISFGATSTSLTVSNNGGTTTFIGGAGIYANNGAASNNPTDLVFWTTSGGTPATRLTIASGGGATFTSSVGASTFNWNSGIGALSYGSGFVTMETNTANAIQFKTNGTTALTLQTNQNGRFANSLGIGKDPSYNLDVNGSIRGSDRLYWNGQSQLVYILNYDQINNADTTTIADSTATNGYALQKSGGSSTFFYGNYTSFPPGNYTAYFRLKVASNASGSYLGQLDIVGANCIGFAISVLPNMFDASNTWQYIKLPFTITGGGYIEWRFVSWTGVTNTFFDHVMIYQEGGEGKVFTRNAYSIYVNQNTLGMQLDTSGNLTATGDVIAYSDERLKTNIETITGALDKVMSLRGVSYNRIDTENKKKKIGVIAQEIQKIIPEVINESSDGTLGVAYGNMVGLLIEAMKEQQKQIDELKIKN